MNEAITYYEPGSDITVQAAAAITAKRFVHIAGNRSADGNLTAQHSAGAKSFGVARVDIALGKKGPIITAPGVVVSVTAGEALAAGDSVRSDATGAAIKPAGAAASVQHCDGVVMTAAAINTDAQVRLVQHSVTLP